MNPTRAHQLLHVPSEMEAGECFLLFCFILCSPLGLLLFLTSSLILAKKKKCRRKDESDWNGRSVNDSTIAGTRSYLQAPLSLFLSLTADSLLLCSLWTALLLHNILHLTRRKGKSFSISVRECIYSSIFISKSSHNPLLETYELFFLLFPALKVNLDQSLQLHQVLLHPFTMYVLQKQMLRASCT